MNKEYEKDFSSNINTRVFYLAAWMLFICTLYQLLTTIDLDFFFNADILYLPALYKDLFVNGYKVTGWRLTPAPYFFPDMGIFFTLMYITGNTTLSFILFGAIQSTALVLTSGFIAKTILKQYQNQAMILMLIMGTAINVMVTNNIGTEMFAYIFIPSIHFGAFITALISLGFVLKSTRENNGKNYSIIFFLSLLSTVSDKFFIVVFITPAICTIFFLYSLHVIPKKNAIKLLITLIISTTFGILSFYGIKHFVAIPYPGSINISKFILSAQKLYGSMDYFATGNVLYYTINCFLWLTVTALLIFFYVKHIRNENDFLKNKPESLQLLFFTVFSAVLIPIVIVTTLLKGYLCTIEFRYMSAVFIIPILGNAIYLSYFFYTSSLSKKKKSLIITVFVTTSCIITLWINSDFSGKLPLEYYPSQIKNFDYYCSKYNLSFGVSDYWNSKVITELSKKNVMVCQLSKKDLKIFHWINNKEWYRNKGKNGEEKPKFNFVVIGHFDNNSEIKRPGLLKEFYKQISPSGVYYEGLYKDKIIKKFGLPIRTIKLDNVEILVMSEIEVVE